MLALNLAQLEKQVYRSLGNPTGMYTTDSWWVYLTCWCWWEGWDPSEEWGAPDCCGLPPGGGGYCGNEWGPPGLDPCCKWEGAPGLEGCWCGGGIPGLWGCCWGGIPGLWGCWCWEDWCWGGIPGLCDCCCCWECNPGLVDCGCWGNPPSLEGCGGVGLAFGGNCCFCRSDGEEEALRGWWGEGESRWVGCWADGPWNWFPT